MKQSVWSDVRVLLIALLVVGVATVSAPVLLIGGWAAYRVGGDYLTRTHFDAEAWKGARGAHSFAIDPVRIHMIDDLLDRHELEGMTGAEVTALLGEPDYGRSSGDEASWPGWDLVYYLGPERGLIAIDAELLAIRLGEHGRVSEYRIVVS